MMIYEYENYVKFLRDWFDRQKEVNKNFSHQFFAQKAGFKSRSYMANILNGARPLSVKNIFKVTSALELNLKESKYFEALVQFKESKDLSEKNYFYSIIQKLKPQTTVNILKNKQYEYFQKWYYPVLRELLTYFDFKGDYKLLGQQLTPPISSYDAKNAVKLLLDLELIKEVIPEKSSGIRQNKTRMLYEQTDKVILGDESEESLTVHSYQDVTLDLAKSALNEIPPTKRTFLTYTFSIDEKSIAEVSEALMEFQEKLISIVNGCSQLSSTHQLNIQYFPLTKKVDI